MPPSRWSISCAAFRFGQSNYYLNITPRTTVGEAKLILFDALKAARPPSDEPILSPEPEKLPASAADIALFVAQGDSWSQLKDDSVVADKWGITDAGEVGVSFRQNGKFEDPVVTRPEEEPEDEDEEADA